jgi:hypothetical protein
MTKKTFGRKPNLELARQFPISAEIFVELHRLDRSSAIGIDWSSRKERIAKDLARSGVFSPEQSYLIIEIVGL